MFFSLQLRYDKREKDMGDRFVVVPVEKGVGVGVAGVGQHSEAVVADPAPESVGSGGPAEEKVAGEDSVFEPPGDPNVQVPILKYNREPNKYGKSVDQSQTPGVPLLISVIHRRIN